jgi:hypothetical protein
MEGVPNPVDAIVAADGEYVKTAGKVCRILLKIV